MTSGCLTPAVLTLSIVQKTVAILLLVLAFATTMPLASNAQPCTCIGNFEDHFEDGSLAPVWTPSTGCGVASETGGQLILSRPSGCSAGATILMDESSYTVCGNFDISVDYALIDFPIPGGDIVATLEVRGLGPAYPVIAIIERYNANSAPCAPGQQNYKAWTSNSNNCSSDVSWVATDHAAGKFRITRTGDTFKMFYWVAPDWIELKSDVRSVGNELLVYLRASSGGGANSVALDVRYDNLTINSLLCPTPTHNLTWGHVKAIYR